MPYPKIDFLEQAWNAFEIVLKSHIDPSEYRLSEIQKLMTADSVGDLSGHAIYTHTEYVHRLTLRLLNLLETRKNDEAITNLCQLWTTLLKSRNQHPLKIMHHKRLDGECTFNFSLQLMEGKPYGFKEIQVLDPNNTDEFDKAVHTIKQLDCLAHGVNFGDLPIVGDTVLSSSLSYKDTICFIAKDVNDQIIGYSWGIMLRDIPAGEQDKANVFWVMNLAKHPDFYDPHVKVGTKLRQYIADMMREKPDCHFLGYQHILNHKFHLEIVDGLAAKYEKINLGQDQYDAKSKIQHDSLINNCRVHLIRSNNNQLPFPKHKDVKSAVFSALWNAAHSVKDFILGGMFFYARCYYQQWTHFISDQPVEQRIEESVSQEQQICDLNILKKIILNEEWNRQGTTSFFDSCIPKTMQKLQQLITEDGNNYSILQKCVANSGWALFRSKLTSYFYFAITQSSNPTAAVNMLRDSQIAPKKWIELISKERQAYYQSPSMSMS
ncbi:Uncharacterised protein [Legionella steigerwaltii]|uniref:Uncharacterized protein n=1 Tax=Legionella steigerwaltii TaxID=460 RepID=A0A378LF78_9GAMM|nr:hypothetical protein [Legionella steigerwaltii]KTD77790.1 hypothetical protein Lstg_1513 [Legionella steigerwaltii]STY24429.1 Uncharacterised protein [Legionella steigerwaltii]